MPPCQGAGCNRSNSLDQPPQGIELSTSPPGELQNGRSQFLGTGGLCFQLQEQHIWDCQEQQSSVSNLGLQSHSQGFWFPPKSCSNKLREVWVVHTGCHVHFMNKQNSIVVGNYLPVETLCCTINSTELCPAQPPLPSTSSVMSISSLCTTHWVHLHLPPAEPSSQLPLLCGQHFVPFTGDLLFGCWLHLQTAGDILLFLLPLVHCDQQWQYSLCSEVVTLC